MVRRYSKSHGGDMYSGVYCRNTEPSVVKIVRGVMQSVVFIALGAAAITIAQKAHGDRHVSQDGMTDRYASPAFSTVAPSAPSNNVPKGVVPVLKQ